MLRDVFQTKNAMTFPVSGTGSAGMEFCCVNLIEPGDEVIIGVNGVFGTRMVDVAGTLRRESHQGRSAVGPIIEPRPVADALKTVAQPKLRRHRACRDLDGRAHPGPRTIPKLAHDAGALMVLDTVTSLGGCPVRLDDWGSRRRLQRHAEMPELPARTLARFAQSRALEVATKRKTKVQSWYLDVNLLASYWGQDRVYHHTAPISMNYALHEALRLVLDEGLEAAGDGMNKTISRQGIEKLGLKFTAQAGHQLWQLNAIGVPEGVDEAGVRKRLLTEFNIEIGAGLGPLKGKIWRIGLMGETSSRENVDAFLEALRKLL